MAWQTKALATKPEGLSSVPRTGMEEGKKSQVPPGLILPQTEGQRQAAHPKEECDVSFSRSL